MMPGDYWEGELEVEGLPEPVGVVVPAPATGPVEAQAEFCRAVLADLDGLFERCRSILAGPHEEWTGAPLPDACGDALVLVGLDLPAHGDATEPWAATHFVEAANHYFTVSFDGGEARHVTVEG
jgi:hypothetical protein